MMTSRACFVLKIKLHADFRSIVSFEAHAFRIVYGDQHLKRSRIVVLTSVTAATIAPALPSRVSSCFTS